MITMAPQSRPSTARTPPAKPERILIADDEHLVAAGLRAQLVELGYSVIGPASDGVQAIELARQHQPDLALLDIRMPRMDGITAAEIISNELVIPVVMVSAYSDPDYLRSCNQFRTYGYVLKPVPQAGLRVTIEIAWGRWLDSLAQQQEVNRLTARLEDRKFIEQAKWVLVKRKGISEPDAMRLLQRHARNNRRPLVDVAKSLIENEELIHQITQPTL